MRRILACALLLALAAGGSLWITEELGGARRLQVDGRTQAFAPSEEDDSAEDVATAPDGSVWVGADAAGRPPTACSSSSPPRDA